MNPKQTIPVLTQLTPVLAAISPPVLIGLAAGAVLLWIFSDKKKETAPETPQPVTETPSSNGLAAPPPAVRPVATVTPAAKRIRREDIATALDYGSRSVPRSEAVAALQALGFHKTAAYKALSASGRFAEFIEIAPDGLIEWKG
jgi:hypothetical protein